MFWVKYFPLIRKRVLMIGAFFLLAVAFPVKGSSENLLLKNGTLHPHSIHGAASSVLKNGKVDVFAEAESWVSFHIPLSPEWKYLSLDMMMEVRNLKPGEQSWKNGRATVWFRDQNQKRVGEWPACFSGKGSFPSKRCQRIYEIPENATFFVFSPGNFGREGSASFSEIQLRGFRNKSEINQDAEIPFPADQKSLWDLKDAYRRKNAFREEICLNGLWQFLGCRDEKALLNAASANSLIKRLDFGFEGDFRYRLPAMWKGKADPEKIGRKAGWFRMDLKMDKSWRPVKVPGAFDLQFRDLKNYDGLFWYRLDFMLPEHALRTRQIVFNLGQVDDESWVWINGKFVGELTQKTNPQNYWGAERRYVLKSQDFRKGRNTIVVLCNDLRNTGGIFGFPEVVALPDSSLYADVPENSDDPYRYYRW